MCVCVCLCVCMGVGALYVSIGFPFKILYAVMFPNFPLPLIVQYMAALAYSFVTDLINLGYRFARTDSSLYNHSEGLFSLMLMYSEALT